MKELYSKMTKAAITRIVLGVLAILVALVFFAAGGGDMFRYLTASKNLFNMNTSDMRAVVSGSDSIPEFYSFKGNMFLDWYGSDDDGYYYILPTYDGTFMGCFVYNSQKDTADAIVEEYQAYVLGETDAEPTTFISGRGYVYEMGSTEKDYFKEYIESAGASASIIGNLVYKTFVIVPLGEIIGGSEVFMLLLAVVFLIAGLWGLISFILGTYKKQPKAYIEKYGISESDLVGDLACALHEKHIDIGRKYAMCYGQTSYLIPYEQLLWAYVHVTKTTHRTNGIKTGTSYSYQVFFAMRDKKKYSVVVKNEQAGQDIVKEICERAPHVIGGYHDDLEKMFNKNIQQLIGIVEEHKAELAKGPEEAANTEEDYEKPDSVSMAGFSIGDSTSDTDSYHEENSDSESYPAAGQSGLDSETFGSTGSKTGFNLKD